MRFIVRIYWIYSENVSPRELRPKRQDFSAGGGWRVAGDGWRVTGSGWRVTGDGWRVAGGGWRVAGGGLKIYMKIKYYNKMLLLTMI